MQSSSLNKKRQAFNGKSNVRFHDDCSFLKSLIFPNLAGNNQARAETVTLILRLNLNANRSSTLQILQFQCEKKMSLGMHFH